MFGNLAGIELVSKDPQRLAEFYSDNFAIKFRREPYGYELPHYISTGPHANQITIQDERNVPTAGAAPRARFVLQVADLPAAMKRLESQGIHESAPRANVGLTTHPWVHYWDRWIASIRDLDGNAVLLRELKNERNRKQPTWFLRLKASWRSARSLMRFLLVDSVTYHLDIVRLLARDVSGFSHVVGSAEGVYVVNERKYRKILDGVFYGITVRDGCIYGYQYHRPRVVKVGGITVHGKPMGRIVKLTLNGASIESARVVTKGLSNNCHQIDFIGGKLHIVDTFHQQIIRLGDDYRVECVLWPLGNEFANGRGGPPREPASGYSHVNSIVRTDRGIFLLLHNGLAKGHCSEVVHCNSDWQVVRRFSIPAGGAHNIVPMRGGELWVCDSRGGNLLAVSETRSRVLTHVGPLLTRGLSVDSSGNEIVVGDSAYSVFRLGRRYIDGTVHFFDRDLVRRASLRLPSAPCDIRRIDGRDLSLSDYPKTLDLDAPGESLPVERSARFGAR